MTTAINAIKSNERIIAWFLLTGGVILPLALDGLLAGSYDYARLSGNIMGILLMVVLVSYLATIGRTPATKNRVMLVVGILVFGYSILASYRVWNDAQAVKNATDNLISTIDNAKSQIDSSIPNSNSNLKVPVAFDTTNGNVANFLNGVQPILKRFLDKSVDLNNRFGALPMNKVLAPDNIVSQKGIAQSRAILAKHKELILERGKNLVAYWNEVTTYFKTAKTDESNRKSAMDSFLSGKPTVEKLYGDLDKVQLASVAESSAILDLAEHNLGRLNVSNGQLLFPEQGILDSYNEHIQNLNTLGQAEAKITQDIQNSGKANMEQTKKDIGK